MAWPARGVVRWSGLDRPLAKPRTIRGKSAEYVWRKQTVAQAVAGD
jgi:hypothetical protein